MSQKLKNLLTLFLPIQIILVKIASRHPLFIEQYYSNGLYLFLSKFWRYTLGWIPFSVGDIAYIILIFFILRWLYKNATNLYKKTRATFSTIFAFLSILYFCFHFFWGMNYYRMPLYQTLDLEKEYTTEQLIKVTEKFIQETNNIHLKIAANDTTKAVIPYSKSQIFEKTTKGYEQLQKKYPYLSYSPRSIKKSILSLPLTYMGYGGYLNPITNEAQVNYLTPKYSFPLVSCHEEAHQIGFAAENETNFIGYLACSYSPDKYFNYAAATFGLRYCLREVYKRDKEKHKTLLKEVNIGVKKNFQESYDFWTSYENPLEPIFKYSYDIFLKANNQQKGIKSYSYVVALLVSYELK